MTKQQFIHKLNEIDSSIKALENQRKEVQNRMIEELCPHKIGQKAKFIRVKTKRVGSVCNPKWEKVSEREEILVCVGIRPVIWRDIDFRYQFKRLKSDGTITQNDVHVNRDEIEWLDEYYEKKD